VYTLLELERGAGVPEIMNPQGARETRALQHPLEVTDEVAPAEWRTDL